jgi:Ras-related protein Rab-7A
MNPAQLLQKSLLKVVVLGDAGVGKTSLVKQYVNGKFDKDYKPTIGADFLTKDVSLPNRGQLKLQIWDTAGQERFRSMAVSFYRGADACVLVYDISDIKTFQNLEMWMKEFLDNVGSDINKDEYPFVVLGNKADKSEEMMVIKSRAEAWCKRKNNVALFETSAVLNQNLNEAFDHVAKVASRCLPSVSLVDVKDIVANPVEDTAFDDGKALEEEPEPEPEPEDRSVNLRDVDERKHVDDEDEEEEPRRAKIRRESPDESRKRGRKKTSKHKKKNKSSRRSSVHGSQTSSKSSYKGSQGSLPKSRQDSREEFKVWNKKSKRRSDSVDSRDREEAQSLSSYDSQRNVRHSRRSTPYRHGSIDSIRLDQDDRYSTESENTSYCCGM